MLLQQRIRGEIGSVSSGGENDDTMFGELNRNEFEFKLCLIADSPSCHRAHTLHRQSSRLPG